MVAAVSILVGTQLSKFAGRHPLTAIAALSEATKEVAKGHFDVAVAEESPIEELRDLAHSFNRMTKELEVDLDRADYQGDPSRAS